MATTIPTIPDLSNRAVQTPANVLDPEYYLFLASLLKVIAEQSTQIETLRLAVNETRANPTTVYSAVPAF